MEVIDNVEAWPVADIQVETAPMELTEEPKSFVGFFHLTDVDEVSGGAQVKDRRQVMTREGRGRVGSREGE